MPPWRGPGSCLAVLFLPRRRWGAWLGLALVWGAALALLLLLSPDCVTEYMQVNRTNAAAMMHRQDNSSLLLAAYIREGWAGVLVGVAFLGMVTWRHRGDFVRLGEPLADARLWALFSYLTVVCLPIAWGYSRAPLIAVFAYLLGTRRRVALVFVGLAVAVSTFMPVWGQKSVGPLIAVDLLAGLALWWVRATDGAKPCPSVAGDAPPQGYSNR